MKIAKFLNITYERGSNTRGRLLDRRSHALSNCPEVNYPKNAVCTESLMLAPHAPFRVRT